MARTQDLKEDTKMISSEDLRKISEHLHYEFDMFDKSARALTQMATRHSEDTDVFCKNLLIESTLIHARILFEVFYPSRDTIKSSEKADDKRRGVLARQVFANAMDWEDIRPLI